MSTLSARSSCVAAAPASLAEVVAAIRVDLSLPEMRRRSVATSIRCFCRLLGLDPAITPVNAYAEAVPRFRPSRAGLRKDRWQNILADLRFALRWAGVAGVPGRNLTAPSPAWQTLLDRLDVRSSRDRIGRFARWCTDQCVTPPQVDQAVLDAFRAGLEAMPQARRSARHTATCLVVVWNRAAETVAGWPQVRLEGSARSRRWTLPLDAYPASLQAELDAYLAWAAGRDPLDEGGPRRPLRPITVAGLRNLLRAFLGALVAEGRPPEGLTQLRDLVEVETVKTGLRHLLARSPRGKAGRAHQVARMLHGIARDRVGIDDEHLGQLRRLCAKLAARVPRGLTDTNRERLRPFDDERHVSALLQLPSDLVRGARRDDHGRKAALHVQIALAIELLLMAPIRRRNLAGLRLDRHISWTRSGRAGVAHLVIPGEEVKNGEPLELELPAETSSLLRLYLDHYRQRLLAGPSPWLFPGQTPHAPKVAQVLAKQVSDMVRERIGLDVHLHLFRHIAAKLYLDAHPGQYEVVRRLLGHKQIETTVMFYAGAETAAAVRHYDDHILERRQRPAPVRRLRSGA
jgi:integrase